jgi:hypothetical protein
MELNRIGIAEKTLLSWIASRLHISPCSEQHSEADWLTCAIIGTGT